MDFATSSITFTGKTGAYNSDFTNFTEAMEVETDKYADLAVIIEKIVLPVLIVFGTIGNILTFLIMRRGSLKKVSTCFYMAMLALADTGLLWSGGFIVWLGFFTDWHMNPGIWTSCKLDYFLSYFCGYCSSLLLSIMSVEKFFALYFPLKTKSICTVKTAKWVTLIMGLVFFAFSLQFFFIIEASTDNKDANSCHFISENYEEIFYRIDTTLYSFGPFTIMIVANLAIIYKFMAAKWRNRHGTSESTDQALSKSAVKGTAMLLTVSFTFIILTGPVAIVYAVNPNPSPMVYAVTDILQYSNHSINGVLYCIVGTRFRNELMNMLCCCSNLSKKNAHSKRYVSESSEGTITTTTMNNVAVVMKSI